jgi:hypothetical protein
LQHGGLEGQRGWRVAGAEGVEGCRGRGGKSSCKCAHLEDDVGRVNDLFELLVKGTAGVFIHSGHGTERLAILMRIKALSTALGVGLAKGK